MNFINVKRERYSLVDDCTIILIGVTGDLSCRKLIPALYRLLADKKLKKLLLVGAAREQTSMQNILHQAQSFIKDINETTWQQLADSAHYHAVNITNKDDVVNLAQAVAQLETDYAMSGRRMVYAAVGGNLFEVVTRLVAETGLIQRKQADDPQWHRIVYEKPFGFDLESAQAINKTIAQYFDEHQVYRIDHYLSKELVSNITLLRFANTVFEPLWNAEFIQEVQIELSERIDVGTRGAFYDAFGALSDVVQNHMLELLALIALDTPRSLHGEAFCNARQKVLQAIECVDGIRGQYRGYRNVAGVSAASKTETYTMLYLTVNNDRWRGVPFYLKTGKCLSREKTAIHIRFKEVTHSFLKNLNPESNWLTIEIAPQEVFSLSLNIRRPDTSHTLIPRVMKFCHSCEFGPLSMYAYERLLEEIMLGERSAAVSIGEIEVAWRIIESIRERNFPLYEYDCDTSGPSQVQAFEERYNIRWRS